MKRCVAFPGFLLLVASLCFAQSTTPPSSSSQSGAPDQNAARGVIPVRLSKSIDSKKLKPGDEIVAKTAAAMQIRNGIMIPYGSKVIGHVTEAKPPSKGDSESTLGIVFDKIQMPGGKDLDIR